VRRNGWESPLNGQQIGAWLAIAMIAAFHFGVVAPAFPLRWRPMAYFLPGACLAVHAALLFICTTMDPADQNVR
jgi:hypothetical protein